MSTRRGISPSTENFVCCSRYACKISKSVADHPSKISISKVGKFYSGFTMIIRENKRVRTSNQNLKHFAIRCHQEKHLNTLIKYRRSEKIYKKYMLAGIKHY